MSAVTGWDCARRRGARLFSPSSETGRRIDLRICHRGIAGESTGQAANVLKIRRQVHLIALYPTGRDGRTDLSCPRWRRLCSGGISNTKYPLSCDVRSLLGKSESTVVAEVRADAVEKPTPYSQIVYSLDAGRESIANRSDRAAICWGKIAERPAGVRVVGKVGQFLGHQGVETLGKLAAMFELPGPESKYLHQRPPRDLIVIGDANVLRGIPYEYEHHRVPRGPLGLLDLRIAPRDRCHGSRRAS